MRLKRTTQTGLYQPRPVDHPLGRELEAISNWLDAHPELLDVVVESGNPADSARCLPMLERHRTHYGKPPTHAAFDGGYASKENLKRARALGVAHAVFSKRRGLKEADMTPSLSVPQ